MYFQFLHVIISLIYETSNLKGWKHGEVSIKICMRELWTHKWHPNWTFDVTLELFSKGYNFVLMSFSIRTCMRELWAHKIMGFIPWIKLGIFWIPWEFETWEFFYHFDATPTTSHRGCYMKGGGGFSPSLGYGVSC